MRTRKDKEQRQILNQKEFGGPESSFEKPKLGIILDFCFNKEQKGSKK